MFLRGRNNPAPSYECEYIDGVATMDPVANQSLACAFVMKGVKRGRLPISTA